jgi:hypothetical protein
MMSSMITALAGLLALAPLATAELQAGDRAVAFQHAAAAPAVTDTPAIAPAVTDTPAAALTATEPSAAADSAGLASGTPPDAPGEGVLPDGERRPAIRVHTGMWTLHLRDMQRGVEANHLLGITWNGYYAVTFINSFSRRAWSAGIERTPLNYDVGPVTASLGYRAGIVSGYDERFHQLASHTPLIPVVQLRASLGVGPGAVEWSYAGIITSVSFNFSM